jgi:hypothetical protein
MITQNDRPFVECRCEGEAHEMGLHQGRALRQKIRKLRLCLRQLEAFRAEQPLWLPYPLFLRLAEARCAKALLPALNRVSPPMLARLQGLAAGSGLPLRSLCLMNAMEAFLSSMEGRTVSDCRQELRLHPADAAVLHSARVPAPERLAVARIYRGPAGRGR